jgi:hypothetical protein
MSLSRVARSLGHRLFRSPRVALVLRKPDVLRPDEHLVREPGGADLDLLGSGESLIPEEPLKGSVFEYPAMLQRVYSSAT